MRNVKMGVVGMALLGLLTVPAVCRATIIQIGFTGVVDSVEDPHNVLESKVQQNDTITGFYIYDSETPDSSSHSDQGIYLHSIAPFGISLSVNDLTFQADPMNVDFTVGIWNKPSYDKYWLTSNNNLPLTSDVPVAGIGLSLDDLSGTAISSIELPSTQPNLQAWQYTNLSVGGGPSLLPEDKVLYEIRGHITSMYLVPEPATLLLFGLGGLFLRRRS